MRTFLRRVLGKLGKRSWRVRVDGVAWRVPHAGGYGLGFFQDDEPWMAPVLRQVLANRDGLFVDAGASLGQTLLRLRGVDPSRAWTGFEPDPFACQYLDELIRLNDLRLCEVVQAGLCDHDGDGCLFSDYPADTSASSVPGFRATGTYRIAREPVPIRLVDAANALKGREIAAVKIDVEGGELEILRGLRGILIEQRPSVICEILPVYETESEQGRFRLARQQELEALMREVGYGMRRIGPAGGLTPVTVIGVHKQLEDSNYLLTPAE